MVAVQQALLVHGFTPGAGLLDGFTSNLWGPSGLDLLRSNYVGNTLRIRRSSDDTTLDVGFNGTSWDSVTALAFTGAANAYANYASVALYVPITGSSGSTSFRCVKGHQCTAVGNAQVSTTLGFPTALFDGNTDRIDIVVGRSVQLAAGDFRIRCKINATTLKVAVIAEAYGGSAAASMFFLQLNNTSGQIAAGIYSGTGTAGVCTSANSTIATGTTYDIEYGRSGTSFQLSVNGTSVATATSSATANAGPTTMAIGGESGAATASFNGHIWGLSIEPGVAGHTGSFTPDALYTTEGDGFVERAYFQNATGAYWNQTTLTAQPRIISNAAALTDIQFDGADDYMVSSINSGTPTAMSAFYKGNFRLDTLASASFISMQHTTAFSTSKGCYLSDDTTNAIGWGVSDGTGNRLTASGPNNSNVKTLGVVGGVFDKSQAGNAKRKAYYNGSEITASSTSTVGTVGTGAFDAAVWQIGGLAGANPLNNGPLNLRRWAIYEEAANAASVSAALA
jgi:hypothetical protein